MQILEARPNFVKPDGLKAKYTKPEPESLSRRPARTRNMWARFNSSYNSLLLYLGNVDQLAADEGDICWELFITIFKILLKKLWKLKIIKLLIAKVAKHSIFFYKLNSKISLPPPIISLVY